MALDPLLALNFNFIKGTLHNLHKSLHRKLSSLVQENGIPLRDMMCISLFSYSVHSHWKELL